MPIAQNTNIFPKACSSLRSMFMEKTPRSVRLGGAHPNTHRAFKQMVCLVCFWKKLHPSCDMLFVEW